MKPADFQKEFEELSSELTGAAEREVDRLKKRTDKPGADKSAATAVKETEDWAKSVLNEFKHFTKEAVDLDKANAEASKGKTTTSTTTTTDNSAVEAAKKDFKKAAESVEKEFEMYLNWVRGKLLKEKFTDEFLSESGKIVDNLRKFEGSLDKYISEQLKRTPKISKPAEIVPSKFVAGWGSLSKKVKTELEDNKLVAALKKCDANHEFDRVNPLCKAAILECTKLQKGLDKKTDKDAIEALDKMAKDIDQYDDYMFLLSRMK